MTQASVIKICGLTTASDARFVLDAGADWIGLNFVSGPRRITMEVAGRILGDVGDPGCAVALLLIDEAGSHEAITDELARWGVRRFQLYGQVTPDVIAGFLVRGFETIAVRTIADGPSLQAADRFVKACGDDPPTYMLLDAASGTRLGGTGQVANWPAIVEAEQAGVFLDWPPLILAGGLHAGNVGEAMRMIAPRGVDVSSGVESHPGQKDPAKVSAFIEAVRRAV